MKLNILIRDFIKRNSPIFVIGGITAILFLIITIISRFKEAQSPTLVPLTDSQIQEFEKTEEPVTKTTDEADTKYGTLEIEYTLEGFMPKNTKSYPNQLVRWTNKTDGTISFSQVTKTHKTFPEVVEIKPGESFEFRLTKTKLWSYQIKDNPNHFGTIFVLDNNN